jgi:uncharacterized protein
MIKRNIENELHQLLKEYPIVTILGPRQAGKTTLAKMALKKFEYCNLELPENREFAEKDPKAFLKQFTSSVIIDEIQRVPQLLSYIQVRVDENQINGEFVLTGSHQLELNEAITQSLAGRTGIIKLLPLSISELKNKGIFFNSFEEYAYHGFLPRIYDQHQRPEQAYSNYYQTYVERDVRLLINLKNTSIFEKFIKLLAGRVGQLIDYSSLANDVGVDAKTIRSWLSILEASYIIFKLPPYFENFGKRVVKAPKYYFVDVGLLVFLLGIEKPEQISRDPLVGNIFENLIVLECLKARLNQGKIANIYFYRDSNGFEVDIILQQGRELVGIEIKSSSTYYSKQFKNLDKLKNITDKIHLSWLVYNGEQKSFSDQKKAISFDQIEQIFSA